MKYTCKKCGAELPDDMTKECPCLKESWSKLINEALKHYISEESYAKYMAAKHKRQQKTRDAAGGDTITF